MASFSPIGLAAAALLAAASASVATATSSATMLEVGRTLARADLIKPGTHRYARYMIKGDARELIDIWTRQVSFETTNGQRLMRIHQRWDPADKSYVAIFDQVFEAGTFRPLAQTKAVTRNGTTKSQSVKIDGLHVDTTTDGAADAGTPLHKTFDLPFYNWHTDMELLQALPLARGYAASIPFYDIGLDPPARYIYAVTGDAMVLGPDGASIPCWIVTSTPEKNGPEIRFWFAKRSQVLVREEVDIPNQGRLVKTLLNAEAADPPA